MRSSLLMLALFTSTAALAWDGPTITQTRSVSAFAGVEIGHGIHATFTPGEKFSAVLTGDEASLAEVTLVVEDGVLKARLQRERWFRRAPPIRLALTAPRLNSVSASADATVEARVKPEETFAIRSSSGSTVKVEGLKAGRLELTASSGSEVTVEGTVDYLKLNVSSGATVRGSGLGVATALLEASSGAEAMLKVAQAIEGNISSGAQVEVNSKVEATRVSTSSGGELNLQPQ